MKRNVEKNIANGERLLANHNLKDLKHSEMEKLLASGDIVTAIYNAYLMGVSVGSGIDK